MKLKRAGFTIVELAIVISVIAILATITVVSYSASRDRADTASRLAEMKAWEKQYIAYYAAYNEFPQYAGAPDGDYNTSTGLDKGYCLGTGYPNGQCRDLGGSNTTFYENSELNTLLAKVGPLPTGPRKSPGANSLGPFARYYKGEGINITNTFKGSVCPAGTEPGYVYSGNVAVLCAIWVK